MGRLRGNSITPITPISSNNKELKKEGSSTTTQSNHANNHANSINSNVSSNVASSKESNIRGLKKKGKSKDEKKNEQGGDKDVVLDNKELEQEKGSTTANIEDNNSANNSTDDNNTDNADSSDKANKAKKIASTDTNSNSDNTADVEQEAVPTQKSNNNSKLSTDDKKKGNKKKSNDKNKKKGRDKGKDSKEVVDAEETKGEVKEEVDVNEEEEEVESEDNKNGTVETAANKSSDNNIEEEDLDIKGNDKSADNKSADIYSDKDVDTVLEDALPADGEDTDNIEQEIKMEESKSSDVGKSKKKSDKKKKKGKDKGKGKGKGKDNASKGYDKSTEEESVVDIKEGSTDTNNEELDTNENNDKEEEDAKLSNDKAAVDIEDEEVKSTNKKGFKSDDKNADVSEDKEEVENVKDGDEYSEKSASGDVATDNEKEELKSADDKEELSKGEKDTDKGDKSYEVEIEGDESSEKPSDEKVESLAEESPKEEESDMKEKLRVADEDDAVTPDDIDKPTDIEETVVVDENDAEKVAYEQQNEIKISSNGDDEQQDVKMDKITDINKEVAREEEEEIGSTGIEGGEKNGTEDNAIEKDAALEDVVVSGGSKDVVEEEKLVDEAKFSQDDKVNEVASDVKESAIEKGTVSGDTKIAGGISDDIPDDNTVKDATDTSNIVAELADEDEKTLKSDYAVAIGVSQDVSEGGDVSTEEDALITKVEEEEAIDKIAGATETQELESTDLKEESVANTAAGDVEEEEPKKGSFGVVGLSKDPNASSFLVDDPPVVGEVPAAASSLIETETFPKDSVEEQAVTSNEGLAKDTNVESIPSQLESTSTINNVDNKSSDGHEYLPDTGSSDGLRTADGVGDVQPGVVAGEGEAIKKTSEWGDDDDTVSPESVAAADAGTLSGITESQNLEGGTSEKTEEQLETEIETKLETALETGEVNEEQAEELEEEMNEALEEGVGDMFEKKLDSQLGGVTEKTFEEGTDTTNTGSVGVVGLSKDPIASSLLVDDPLPVVGEVPAIAEAPVVATTSAFQNLSCEDDPASYLAADNICESIKMRGGEGCNDVLFTDDNATAGVDDEKTTKNIDGSATDLGGAVGAQAYAAGDTLRVEEEVHATYDAEDGVDNEERRNEERRLYDEDDEVQEDPQDGMVGSSRSINPTSSSKKPIVTVGMRHCPVTCNVVSECEAARDYFNPGVKSISDTTEQVSTNTETVESPSLYSTTQGVESSTVYGSTGVESVGDNNPTYGLSAEVEQPTTYGSTGVSNTIDQVGSEESEVPSVTKEGEFGQDHVSEGKVASEVNCVDDPNFLYKLKPGYDCAYVASADKCDKLHNEEKVGITSCPESCGMVEQCKEMSKGVDAPSDDADDDNVEMDATGTDLNNTNPSNAIIEEEVELTPSQDSSPKIDVADNAVMAEASCEDDIDFLYKDKPGFTCAYIGQYKPDKCDKLHDGEVVGIISCPVSCNMVAQCKEMYSVSGAVMTKKTNLSLDNIDEKDQSLVEESSDVVGSTDSANDIEEKNLPVVDSGGMIGDEDVKISAVNEETEEESTDGGVQSNTVYDPSQEDNGLVPTEDISDKTTAGYGTGLDANGWSADSEDEPSNQEAVEPSSTVCKDSETFLYKEKPGWDCAYIGESDPNKCLKLHNGVSVGIADCPKSCNMVDKCLEAAGLGTESGVAGSEVNDPPAATQYDQEPAATASTDGSVMQRDSLGFGEEEEEKDEYPKEVSNEEMSSLVGTGTKSMADELENSENSFGNDNSGDGSNDVQDEPSDNWNATQEEDEEDSFGTWDGINDNGEDAWNAEKNDSGNSNWNGVEDNGDDAWNADGEENKGEDYESLDNWKDEDSADIEDVDKLPWDTPSAENLNQPIGGGFDSYQGTEENAFNAEPTNNLVPSGQDTAPSANSEYAWELEDEDSFPVGLFIALLAVFIFFIYKKSQSRNQPNTRDCTSRGGYQPVQRMDHSKKW